MKFPYGISDFREISLKGHFYCDRTDRITLLEADKYQLFIRPRRFGKSLLLSMLENYYDIRKADEFESMFGHLSIGRNPTSLHNKYLILRLDFSCVDPTGDVNAIQRSFYGHINGCVEGFKLRYRAFDIPEISVHEDDAIRTFKSLMNAVDSAGHRLYLLIDEYDNFANEVMMGVRTRDERYTALVHEDGPLKTFFKVIKSATSSSVLDRIFITGVSPVVMSDITSGYNIAENVYLDRDYNNLCGFTEKEVEVTIHKIYKECGMTDGMAAEAMSIMQTYYNGYTFSPRSTERVYNPTLCLYFFKYFQKNCEFPDEMLDANLAVDEAKLEYVSLLPGGSELLIKLSERSEDVTISTISRRFGLREMLSAEAKDNLFIVSFLYYFGVLTINGRTEDLELRLCVPNLVIQSLYVERIRRMFLPDPLKRDEGREAAKILYRTGDIAPLCQFMEQHYFRILSNRDYRLANELVIKTAFLTLLYNDILYIMDSEPEIHRGYADLTMILRPDRRHAKVYDILIEFKFVSIKDTGLSGKTLREIGDQELHDLTAVKKAREEGCRQATEYAAHLVKKYGNILKLKAFVAVAVGFERMCCKAVEVELEGMV